MGLAGGQEEVSLELAEWWSMTLRTSHSNVLQMCPLEVTVALLSSVNNVRNVNRDIIHDNQPGAVTNLILHFIQWKSNIVTALPACEDGEEKAVNDGFALSCLPTGL
jgi:hypothetical protein